MFLFYIRLKVGVTMCKDLVFLLVGIRTGKCLISYLYCLPAPIDQVLRDL